MVKRWLTTVGNAIRSYWQGPWPSGDPLLARILGIVDAPAAAGIAVSEYTALNCSAVWAAVQVISGAVGSLPLILYRRLPNGGKERFVEHRLYRLLHDEPNPEMGAMVFREALQAHLLLWGNAYAEIQRDQGGRPFALWPLTPNRVQPRRTPRTRRLVYDVTNEEGRHTTLEADDILHIPGLGFDGIQGYSVVRMAREAIALGLATEKFGANFFGNGSLPGGVLQHPGRLGKDAGDRMRKSWEEIHQGPQNAHRIAVLEEGTTWQRVGIPPDDAQFLETRKFQILEVARWFNIPPHKLRDLERATFSNIEQQSIEFVTDTLRPWLVRWEQEVNRKLIAPSERRIQFAEHLIDGLLRGDTGSRYSAYATGRQWGWLSADDIRERENMNPLKDGTGEIYLVPSNMMPADRVLDDPPPQSQPDTTESPDDVTRAALTAFGSFASLSNRVEEQLASMQGEIAARLDEIGQHSSTVAELLRTQGNGHHSAAEWARSEVAVLMAARSDEIRQALDRLKSEMIQAMQTADSHEAEPATVPEPKDPRLITAQRAVIHDVVGRMVRREAAKARRAATDPAKFRRWLDTFYPRHADIFLSTILPAVQSHLAVIGSDQDAHAYATILVDRYVDQSRAAFLRLLEPPPSDLEAAVDDLVSRWEIERAADIADRLLQEEIAHATAPS